MLRGRPNKRFCPWDRVCSIHANTDGAHSVCTVNIPALGLPRRWCTCRSGEDDATELSLLFINISTLQGLNCLHVAPDLPQSDASGLPPPAGPWCSDLAPCHAFLTTHRSLLVLLLSKTSQDFRHLHPRGSPPAIAPGRRLRTSHMSIPEAAPRRHSYCCVLL